MQRNQEQIHEMFGATDQLLFVEDRRSCVEVCLARRTDEAASCRREGVVSRRPWRPTTRGAVRAAGAVTCETAKTSGVLEGAAARTSLTETGSAAAGPLLQVLAQLLGCSEKLRIEHKFVQLNGAF